MLGMQNDQSDGRFKNMLKNLPEFGEFLKYMSIFGMSLLGEPLYIISSSLTASWSWILGRPFSEFGQNHGCHPSYKK